MKKKLNLIILLMLVTTLSAQNSSHSYSIEPGLILIEQHFSSPFFNSSWQEKLFSISYYYSHSWALVNSFEYRLKPGIMLNHYKYFNSVQLGNSFRYWINNDYHINVENYIEFHPFHSANKAFTFTCGVSFGLKLKDALFIVPAFYKSIASDYGFQQDLHGYIKLGFEWNY